MTRRLQPFEIQTASGTLTDRSAWNTATPPLALSPKIQKLLKDVKVQTKQIGITKPFVPKWYFDFTERDRHLYENLKPGDSVTVTMGWFDIYDEPYIVDRVEGLRVYLKKGS